MLKSVLIALTLLACTSFKSRQPSAVSTDTSVTDTSGNGAVVDSSKVGSVVDTPSTGIPHDSISHATDPSTISSTSEKLCLLLKMPNGKVRLLSQQAGVKQCEAVYKSLPDSLKTTTPSDRYAYKSGNFIAIQLGDWKKGWSPGKDTVSRRLELY